MSASSRPMSLDRTIARLRAGEAVRVMVVGAGRSGVAAARLLLERGAHVSLLDDVAARWADAPRGASAGPFESQAVEAAELVVLSPGVPRSRPELAPAIAGGRLVGEIELASWFVSVPLVGITGTNGKSTTTALVGHLLEAAGIAAFVGGNLGTPLSELAMRGQPVDLAVLELSSYQLESVVTARFRVGAWLNLQPDHLDRYPSIDAYAAAKARLFERVDEDGVVVASATDPCVRGYAERSGKPLRWFAVDAPLPEPGGVRVEAAVAHRGDERYRVEGPGLLGAHNHENAAAAIEIARGLGARPEAVQVGLTSFRALPHRLALVHEADGVVWYDDSKATNVDAAVTAVRAMTGPFVLIAGGRDKGGSWEALVRATETSGAIGVLAIGEASPVVERAFRGRVRVEEVGTLAEAVTCARRMLAGGGAVLLAPACASFDQFENYVKRGEAFARLARGEEQRE